MSIAVHDLPLRVFKVLVVAMMALSLSGCGGDRITEVGSGGSVRLSDSWTMVVPDGWNGIFTRHDRSMLDGTAGLHSDISLVESEPDHETFTFIWVHVMAGEALGRERIEAGIEQEGARLVRDAPEVATVVAELETKWVFYEYRRGPAGEHLWLHVIQSGGEPWMPEVLEVEKGDRLMEFLQLSESE